MSDIEITVEDMLADDPELEEDDFPIFEVTEDPYGFDARSDEILERTRGLDY